MKSKKRSILFFSLCGVVITLACALPSLLTSRGPSILDREAQRTENPDSCDLTQYLGVTTTIDRELTGQGESGCDFTLNFENQHPTFKAIPVVQAAYIDCYADANELEWQILEAAKAGGSTPWWGYRYIYTEKDCVGGIVSRMALRAALIKDDQYCRSRVTEGSALYSEEHFEIISKEINTFCPGD